MVWVASDKGARSSVAEVRLAPVKPARSIRQPLEIRFQS
jgi:hypothetical protein